MSTFVDLQQLSPEQKNNAELHRILSSDTALQLKLVSLDGSFNSIYCDISQKRIRSYAPAKFRTTMFNIFHNPAQTSPKSTSRQIREKYVWPSTDRDVVTWAKNCQQCQRAKVSRHVHNEPKQFPLPTERFKEVHIDIVGRIPPSNGSHYILPMMDRSTRWPEAIPIADMTAECVASAFYNTWIARYGAPRTIVTDQDSQFESAEDCSCWAFRDPQRTTQRADRTLAPIIESSDHLSRIRQVDRGLTNRSSRTTHCSRTVYGTILTLPGELLVRDGNSTDMTWENFELLAWHHHRNNVFVYKALHSCSHVLLRQNAAKPPLTPQ
ncbi:uncharacterized protein LOC119647089 [Hermetia illucens]|uniref:uncharacterized protein LOC119647089 n=1 Tax=Hermetia illucens TaxID=343691 RepID=UPI0018CC4D76|nr:uncharacterized protein LOC119647089 [Hermetia illucens]